jgi:hypothetical protein
MATLEALDELYAMGFLIEEEYHARRAALGAPPKEPASQTGSSDQSVSTTSHGLDSNPYEPTTNCYDPYAIPVVETTAENTYQPVQDHPVSFVPQYETPISSYETPYTPYTAPIDETANHHEMDATYGYNGVETNIHDQPETVHHTPVPSATSTEKGEVAEALPPVRGPVVPENPYPTPTVQFDVTSLANLKISPSEDTSHADAFQSIPFGKAAIVNRTNGSYTIHHVDASDSPFTVLLSLGLSEHELGEAGQWKTETTTEMYWKQVTYVAPEAATKLEQGKVYLVRPSKLHYGRKYWSGSIDERIINKHLLSTLERTPLGVATVDIDMYEGEDRIRDVRVFGGLATPSPFDPREVYKYHASKLEPYPIITANGSGEPRPFKVQCSKHATPTYMLWPIFSGLLRALEVHMPSEHTHVLPTSAVGIWARIQNCIENQTCYITGTPTAYQSFLSERLHNENIWNLYTQIKQSKEQHGVVPNPDGSGTLAVSTPTSKGQDAEEMISYDTSAKKRSYGWPLGTDLDQAPTRANGTGRLVSAHRSSFINKIISELVQLTGPSPMMEA